MEIRPIAMRDAFLNAIYSAMVHDEHIFFISADFGSPVLDKIRADFPERFVNVGIAEQNLINVSAGLALEGFKVFAYAIAPFITMRCYEQIRVNLALLSNVRPLNVTLIGVGAGYSYVVSGPTHQCYEDLTVMRALPCIKVYSPSDHLTAAALFPDCVEQTGIKYLRLDAQVLPILYDREQPNVARGFNVIRQGKGICLLATGYMVHTALQVAENLAEFGIQVKIIDLFAVTNFDSNELQKELATLNGLVTMEEGFRGRGGIDALMFNFITEHNLELSILNLGVKGEYRFELGSRSQLHEEVGIGVNTVTRQVTEFAKTIMGTVTL